MNDITKTLRDLAAAADARTVDGASFVTVPDGYRVEDLERLQARPNRIKRETGFAEIESLAQYLARFERDETIAFSSVNCRTIGVVIDYHRGGVDIDTDLPSHCDHTASFTARFSPAYGAWRTLNSRRIPQREAVEFLEERSADVIEPEAADIMEMVMRFEALKKVNFRQSIRLSDGHREFQYSEESEAKGSVKVPERIKLRLPVFDGQPPQDIIVRIRYRIGEGGLVFSFHIHDIEDVERAAFLACEAALAKARPKLLILRT